MKHRTVSDLMTRSVVRVHPATPFKEIVKLLADNDITAVPVVDATGRPVGVVSEADLLRAEADRVDPSGLPPEPAPDAHDPAATTAGRLMTSPAVSARPEWTVVQAARVMESRRIKRLPVVDDSGLLVGVVSRADLLRVFLRRDRAIREEISGDVLDRTLGIAPSEVAVSVTEGRVTLDGVVGRSGLIPVVIRLCRGVDGVVDVTGELRFRTDDALAASATPGGGPRKP